MAECMLTTYDNPYNPFTHFDLWFKEDMRLGHNACGILGSRALTVHTFSDELNDELTEEAIDEIVASDPTLYRKVTANDYINAEESER